MTLDWTQGPAHHPNSRSKTMAKGITPPTLPSCLWFRVVFALSVVYTTQCSIYHVDPFCSFVCPSYRAQNQFPQKTKNKLLTRPACGRELSSRSLFFRSVETPRKEAPWRIPETAMSELLSGQASFPYEIQLDYVSGKESVSGESNDTERMLTVRYLEVDDLVNVLPICAAEFGPGKTVRIGDFPFGDLSWPNVKKWWESLTFERLLEAAMRLKIRRRKDGNNPSNPCKPDDNILCLSQDDQIVGIVELSLEPPFAERNPPPYPVPMWIKELFCEQKGIPPPDGWVTNLLVDERYRRLGYSKVLMGAAEGLARAWGCNYIYLHTVADTVSGAVPQSLYKSLRYEPVVDQRSAQKFSWMGPELLNSGLYVVEGVPLLFLRKRLHFPQ